MGLHFVLLVICAAGSAGASRNVAFIFVDEMRVPTVRFCFLSSGTPQPLIRADFADFP